MKSRFQKVFGTGDHKLELAVARMGARDQLKMKARVLKLLASVGSAINGVLFQENEEDEAAIIMGIVQSMQDLDTDAVIDLIVELTEQCFVVKGGDSYALEFSSTFDSRPLIMTYQVAIWVLKENFQDFISGSKLKSLVKATETTKKKASLLPR